MSHLYVEGTLDVTVITSLLSTLPGGGPAVRSGGGKASLRPRVTEERKKLTESCYLRDRDFDNDPPDVVTVPTIDKISGGVVHGWRWCRHEIESYLLEPEIVAQATGWSRPDFERALLTAAGSLRHYTAARWTVGTARRALPPIFELPTRPETLTNPIKIPADLSEAASRAWAADHLRGFGIKVQAALADETLAATLERWSVRLNATTTPQEALLWNAGKDLLAALEPEITRVTRRHPVVFCHLIRDWISADPAKALVILPEWSALIRMLT